MSLVNLKGVVHGLKTLFGTEPASDKYTASTNENARATSLIPYDLTAESFEPESPAIKSRYFDSTVNKRAAERGQQKERQQIADQETHTEYTSTQNPEVHSQPALSSSRNRDARKSYKRDRSSPEERRALGIPEKTPRDAVIVKIPKSPYESGDTDMLEMPPRAVKRVTPNQPFKPLNTLAAQQKPRSERQRLLDQNIIVDTVQSKGTKYTSKQTLKQHNSPDKISANNIRANNHMVPQKRPRVGPSPLEGTAKDYAINLEESQERKPLRPVHTDLSRGYPGLSEEDWPTGSRLLDPPVQTDTKPLKRGSRIARPVQNRTGVASDHSRDELYEEETENFTKNARAQRLREEGNQHSDRQLDHNYSSRLEHLNKQLDSSPDPVEQQSGISEYFQNAPSMPSTSRHIRLPDDSPDALQSDVHTTSETPTKPGAPLQHQRASAIAEHINASAKRSREKSRHAKSKEKSTKYSLDVVLHPEVDGTAVYLLVLYHAARSMQIVKPESMLGDYMLDIDLDAVQKIYFAPDSTKIMVCFRGGVSPAPYFLIEFSSPETCVDFLNDIQSLTNSVKLADKGRSYIEQAFGNGPKKMKEISQYELQKSRQRRRSDDHEMFPGSQERQKLGSVRKSRLVDKLDRPPDKSEELSSSSTIITGADRSGERRAQTAQQRPLLIESKLSAEAEDDSNKSRPARAARTTRSQTSNFPDQVLSRPDVYEGRTAWKQPLVYPTNGKNCATVVYDDLKRLNDDEFLNDNLVGLFLRYLQEHATPEALKRMHFFNSFFFEALTKERKSKGGINYEAVSRWTKKINIFKRDFVIVPVNESHHWFVMIICNLPRLKKAHDPEDQGEETDEIEEIAPPDTIHDDKIILSSDLPTASETAARESFQDLSLDENVQESSIVSHRKAGKRKFKRALPKYDIGAPVIITLDSLDQPRSGTATALRSYIQALAADEKQGHQAFQIDAKAEIKGMTGKGIPHQTNFSDCGLYLCMYLEQFMTDPTRFVQRILRREEADQGWPNEIESGTLRDRLLGMIVELQKQQELRGRYEAVIPSIGSILVNMQTPEANQRHRQILAAKEYWQRQKANEDVEVLGSPPQRPVKEHADESDKAAETPSSRSGNHARNSAIVIEEVVPGRQTEATSQHFLDRTKQRSTENSFDNAIPVVQLDTPVEMAARIRRERSPEQTPVGIETVSESISGETERRMSISTDFLSSDEPFRMNDFSESEPKKPAKNDEGDSGSKRAGQVSGKMRGRNVSYDDGLDIAQQMIFKN